VQFVIAATLVASMVKPKLPSTSSAAYRSSPDAVQLARQLTVKGSC